jgi:hypothetical protein
VKHPGDRLFDPVRGKSVRAFPEERVRRRLVDWLTDSVGVPARLIAVEYSLSQLDARSRKRADVVVWRPATEGAGGLNPWLLAECKAPGVTLTDAVADQVRRYAEKIRADHVLITNGVDTRCFHLREGSYAAREGLPPFRVPGNGGADKKKGG